MEEMNTVLENTTSNEPETSEVPEVSEAPESAQQGAENTENTTEDGEQSANAAEPQTEESSEPFLEIRYNHESKGLTRDEAVTLAQKGLHYEGAYKTLERVATLKGMSVKEFLNGMETAQDEAYRQELVDKFGDDEDTIDRLMELYIINKQKTLDAADESRKREALEAEQSVNTRIAQEFSDMKNGDFPELTEYKALPAEVKKAAAEGMSLSHAYLIYMHKENKKINAAKAAAEVAAKKSTGSMADNTVDSNAEAERRYLNALWGR